jgi:ribonuclease HI
MIQIYTDGACSVSTRKGGWGAYIIFKDKDLTKKIKISGNSEDTTNNRMEMTAVIKSLKYFKTKEKITIYSDSIYVIKGITEWIDGWKKKDWKKVKNIDLWKQIDDLNQFHTVSWNHVPAHSGVEGNEIADKLAVSARLEL